ncbi:uncharacterized protein LOC105737390 isoform X1 [Apis florea]|uniref:uncharacterized protein LOC105737390 isoform X1 n=1 Tax=Apis florea TaxID=7463 RepID=UPI0006298321|nr:uncharacterized protein LOC105737390 isoform X1 [Apis florea]
MFLVVRDRMHRHVPALRVVGEHIQRWNFVIEKYLFNSSQNTQPHQTQDKDNSRDRSRLPSSSVPRKARKKTGCPSIARSHLLEMATGPPVDQRRGAPTEEQLCVARARREEPSQRNQEKETSVGEKSTDGTTTEDNSPRKKKKKKKKKKKSTYRLVRLALIHSDPFYLENSSRKGRSISRNLLSVPSGSEI